MNYNFYSKILIISAHPDDLEISCAGTVKKFIKAGTVVDNLIMIPNVPHLKYLDSSAFGLGFNYIVFDNDIDRPNIVDNKLIQEVEEKYSLFGYDLIISHWKEDWHQDHRMCYHLTNSLRRKQPIDVWYMDAFPYNQKYNQFRNNVFVGIDNEIEDKIKAVKEYKNLSEDTIDSIIKYNRYRGDFINCDFAETFMVDTIVI
tara:strand:+ start:3784 stop:4386 length:603 start_codon:yes stop_codon:yes gene_type:complete